MKHFIHNKDLISNEAESIHVYLVLYTKGTTLEPVGESVCFRKSSLQGQLLYAKTGSTVRRSGIEIGPLSGPSLAMSNFAYELLRR